MTAESENAVAKKACDIADRVLEPFVKDDVPALFAINTGGGTAFSASGTPYEMRLMLRAVLQSVVEHQAADHDPRCPDCVANYQAFQAAFLALDGAASAQHLH